MSEDIDRYTLTKQAVFLLRGLLKAKPANNEEVSCHCPFHKDKTPSMFISLKNWITDGWIVLSLSFTLTIAVILSVNTSLVNPPIFLKKWIKHLLKSTSCLNSVYSK